MPRVLSIQDLSGFGHTSLMATIPILYRMGTEVAALPSALLSANTDYPDYQFYDTLAIMRGHLEHWKAMQLGFDAIHTGFLGSPLQIELLLSYLPSLKRGKAPLLVDPVMADAGKLYDCYDFRMVTAMRKLVASSDIITPNFTEAAFLLEEVYPKDITAVDMQSWCLKLAALGPQHIIITSAPSLDPGHSNVLYYNKLSKQFSSFSCAYIPICYPGTGDCFASLLLGGLMNGYTVPEAVSGAVIFLHKAISESFPLVRDRREGIDLALALKTNPLACFSKFSD